MSPSLFSDTLKVGLPCTECYLAVNAGNEVMFIDPETGTIAKTVKLDYQLNDIRFLRKQAESF